LVSMCTADNVEQLLAGNPDYVLDAIDNIDTKVVTHCSLDFCCRPVACQPGMKTVAVVPCLHMDDV
jgi:tRNA A37 threonylcarbamoyladenosine dehydratase